MLYAGFALVSLPDVACAACAGAAWRLEKVAPLFRLARRRTGERIARRMSNLLVWFLWVTGLFGVGGVATWAIEGSESALSGGLVSLRLFALVLLCWAVYRVSGWVRSKLRR